MNMYRHRRDDEEDDEGSEFLGSLGWTWGSHGPTGTPLDCLVLAILAVGSLGLALAGIGRWRWKRRQQR